MLKEHVALLACPVSKGPLVLLDAEESEDGRVRTGSLLEEGSGHNYPIVDFVPRFVPPDNYASSFGLQWNIHARTQADTHSGFAISKDRFERETRWGNALEGKTLLEVGSGSGRFTPHALATGATVVSLDYSNAVEANYRQNGGHPRLLIVQASLEHSPFPAASFDHVCCFGVLQHTRDVQGSFRALVDNLKPGGRIASDVYLKSAAQLLLATKYKVRGVTRNLDPEKLYRWVRRYVNFMWPLARVIRKLPYGKSINWLLLVADYSELLPGANDDLLKEWAVLDSFDMVSPRYDKPQTLRTFKRWHEEAGLVEIDVHYGFNGIEGRGRKPIS